ncbi:MAG: Wadjet anti-phage system protein JetD domain-containing protein [Desulforhopalus sp.]
MAVDALAEKLLLLELQGSLAASRLTARDRRRLQSLFETGVLTVERSGAGKRVMVKNRESLGAFVQRFYPSGLLGTGEDLSPRSRAVAEFRDSKKAREAGPLTVLMRGFGNCEFRAGGEKLDVARWTELAGVAAICLEGRLWEFTGVLAVVENLEVFYHFEKLKTGAELAIYAQGRLSDRVLNWLSSPAMARAGIIHCGDYDPVGLDEFLRLKEACSGRTTLYLPANLEELLSRYGKRDLLLGNSATILARLRKTEDQEVRQIVELIDRYGVGLEQEILLY